VVRKNIKNWFNILRGFQREMFKMVNDYGNIDAAFCLMQKKKK